MGNHITPEEARALVKGLETTNFDNPVVIRTLRSLADQLEAARKQLWSDRGAWLDERKAAQEVIEKAMAAETWEECYAILEAAKEKFING